MAFLMPPCDKSPHEPARLHMTGLARERAPLHSGKLRLRGQDRQGSQSYPDRKTRLPEMGLTQ